MQELVQVTPSICHHNHAKASKYAGLSSSKGSWLNNIEPPQSAHEVICFEDLQDLRNLQPIGNHECCKKAIGLPCLYPVLRQRKRIQNYDFANWSLGIMICNKMREPETMDLQAADRELGLPLQSGQESTQCKTPESTVGSIDGNNATTMDVR